MPRLFIARFLRIKTDCSKVYSKIHPWRFNEAFVLNLWLLMKFKLRENNKILIIVHPLNFTALRTSQTAIQLTLIKPQLCNFLFILSTYKAIKLVNIQPINSLNWL